MVALQVIGGAVRDLRFCNVGDAELDVKGCPAGPTGTLATSNIVIG